jgi:hypothetical protein
MNGAKPKREPKKWQISLKCDVSSMKISGSSHLNQRGLGRRIKEKIPVKSS